MFPLLPPEHRSVCSGHHKIGVLHSLSGTMAISETTLKDTVLMMVKEQNKKDNLLGKKLQAVVVEEIHQKQQTGDQRPDGND